MARLVLLLPVAAFANPLAGQANPVNLYVAELRLDGDSLRVGAPRKLTGDRGRNSQPSFTPDGRAIVFSAVRDSTGQGDIYRIELATGVETRVTRTAENENSPTAGGNGEILAIRWVPATLFREWGLWVYGPDGEPRRGVLPGPDTVGYYLRADEHLFALMRPAARFSVALHDTRTGQTADVEWPVATLPPQRIPGARAVSFTRTDSAGRHQLRRLDLDTREVTTLLPTLPGRTVHAWADPGVVLMAKGSAVYAAWPAGAPAWHRVAGFGAPDLQDLAAYAVSPDGSKLILTSPLKAPLHVALRDTLDAGATDDVAAAWLRGLRTSGRLEQMFLAEGPLLGSAGRRVPVLEVLGELFPAAHRVHRVLGEAYAAAGAASRAAEAYRRALELNPRATPADREAAEAVERALRALAPDR